ncbi:MAG: helix-turn-helix domain-containing protein [Flavobacteriales bacterium]|nr:helix-turn-helix domain-containing protein [Flavobacteriales bacterium]
MAEIATKDELEFLLDQKLEKFAEKILEIFKAPNFSQRKWLKAAELKKILPLSDYRITEMRARGLLNFQKLGGTYYYAVDSIDNLINSKIK